MKRTLTLLLAQLALGAPAAQAQLLPNGALEAWTTSGNQDHAEHWLTTDDLLTAALGLPVATGTTTRTPDAHGGSWAARLETRALPLLGNTPAHLALGDQVSLPATDFTGLPFAERPTALQLYYKLLGPSAAADSASIRVVLTRWVGGRREVVARADTALLPVTAYTLCQVPLRYQQAQAPDSLHVIITSGAADAVTAGTTLYVDDISLSSTALAARAARPDGRLSCYPNPSPDGRFVLSATEPNLAGAAFTVCDALGRVVLAQPTAAPAATTRAIDLHGQPAGIYTLRLAAASGPVAQRLVVP